MLVATSKRLRCALSALLLCLTLGSAGLFAQQQQPAAEAARLERLVALCKLWGAIKYFHPYLAYRRGY